MEKQTMPTATQFESFNKKYRFYVEVQGQAQLTLNEEGRIILGEAEDLEDCGRSYCTLYLGDFYKATFEGIKYSDDLFLDLIRFLHDKSVDEALEVLQSDEFPYSVEH